MSEVRRRISRRAALGVIVTGLGVTGVAVARSHGAGESAPNRDTPRIMPSASMPSHERPPPGGVALKNVYDQTELEYSRRLSEQGRFDNDAGALAWDVAYALQSYLTMYRATLDSRYLSLFVSMGYRVLNARDTNRGLADFAGEVRPVWSSAAPYTAGWRDLVDITGTPLVRLRSVSGAASIHVRVQPQTSSESFDLTVSAAPDGPRETITGLSLDPSSRAYVVSILQQRSPTPCELSAVALPSPHAGAAAARADAGMMTMSRYAFAAHTGMIASPLAEFAALVGGDAQLGAPYGGPASDFLAAARDAVHAHDADWVLRDVAFGLYRFAREAPVRADGTYLPINQFLLMGRALTHLFVATGEPEYADKARSMMSVFRSELSPGPAPTWSYYWSKSKPFTGYSYRENISSYSPTMRPTNTLEDTGHGALDIECIVLGNRLGLGLGEYDMGRLARTFMQRIPRRVGGKLTGADSLAEKSGTSSYDLSLGRWAGLSAWDPDVLSFVRKILADPSRFPVRGETLASISTLAGLRP